MECPKCWHSDSLAIDYTPEYNNVKPYEIVCYNCGWFSKRYATKAIANKALKSDSVDAAP